MRLRVRLPPSEEQRSGARFWDPIEEQGQQRACDVSQCPMAPVILGLSTQWIINGLSPGLSNGLPNGIIQWLEGLVGLSMDFGPQWDWAIRDFMGFIIDDLLGLVKSDIGDLNMKKSSTTGSGAVVATSRSKCYEVGTCCKVFCIINQLSMDYLMAYQWINQWMQGIFTAGLWLEPYSVTHTHISNQLKQTLLHQMHQSNSCTEYTMKCRTNSIYLFDVAQGHPKASKATSPMKSDTERLILWNYASLSKLLTGWPNAEVIAIPWTVKNYIQPPCSLRNTAQTDRFTQPQKKSCI